MTFFVLTTVAIIAGFSVMIVKSQRLRLWLALVAAATFLIFLVRTIQILADTMGVPL